MKKERLSLLLLTLISLTLVSCNSNNNNNSSSEDVVGDPVYFIPEDEDLDTTVSANDVQYDVSNVEEIPGSYLKDKKIYWLGSSVTYGASSEGQSMADFIAKRSGCTSVKEAVSGTTLLNDGLTQNTGAKSYVNRLITSTAFDKEEEIDAFVCQISTNDCTNDRLNKRGRITPDDYIELDDFNVATSLGAVEYIIAYVMETWGCPVYFYSGSYFSDGSNKAQRQNNNPLGSEYAKFIGQVQQIADKWDNYYDYHVQVIDLYNDEDFNDLASDKYYNWAINDPIHPRKAGYSQWWSPYIQNFLEKDLYELNK